jgi:molybdenum cofactor cytidylyltransferase
VATGTCNPADSFCSILLAAGASSRYGSPKQLACVAGRTMLRTTMENVSRATPGRVILVLGAHAPALRVLLGDFTGTVVINAHWSEGIASSIRTGMAHVPDTAAAAMIVLADQPFVSAADLGKLVGAWRESPDSVAAATYQDTVGVPAIFPKRMFSDLLRLRGDAGARQLLHREPGRLLRVPMPSAGLDIDTPQDLVDAGFASSSRHEG